MVTEKKKISEAIDIRINLGNFQHIEIVKYATKEIEYSSEEEMIKKEDQLTDELLANIIRNMRRIPERLGKKTDCVQVLEESLIKSIPEWLEKEEIPNIAEKSRKVSDVVNAEIKDKIDKDKTENEELDEILGTNSSSTDEKQENDDVENGCGDEMENYNNDEDDLFG